VQGGGQTFLMINSMVRQLQALQLMRASLDEGTRSATDIVAAARPPVFFSRKKIVETALRRLSAPVIERSLQRLHTALLQTRRRPDLAEALTRQALLGIAIESARLADKRS
jgi:DNA polymerase-3 subunit delta